MTDPSERLIVYTATIITFDGSATTAYGEPCEPGHGYSEADGFWDPRRYWRLEASRDRVRPDVCPARCRQPARWLARRITARLGGVDAIGGTGASFSGCREAVYPGHLTGARADEPGMVFGSGTFLGDAITASRLHPPAVGLRTLTACAHASGFTTAELAEAAGLLGLT
ncbi:MAG: hypothetical protein HKP61_15970 [Dactylosporangium sp.]|nr:hypothetical protein [Dactylosporangium sp.]NNJ62403.1 hypothetical protein [Dactylosporangium sp.]